ncbi:MAG: hypothetical protein KJS91_18010, partial [Planctomycetes bacterium]|nr:hypothetical protein [Planctomycetota bacterium]
MSATTPADSSLGLPPPAPAAAAAATGKEAGTKRANVDAVFFRYDVAGKFFNSLSPDDFFGSVGDVYKPLPPKPTEGEEEEGCENPMAAWLSANAEQIAAVNVIIDILKGLKISLEQFRGARLQGEPADSEGKLPVVQERWAINIYNALVAIVNKRRKKDGAHPPTAVAASPTPKSGSASPAPAGAGASPPAAGSSGQMVPYVPPLPPAPYAPYAASAGWTSGGAPFAPIPSAYGARSGGGEAGEGATSSHAPPKQLDFTKLPAPSPWRLGAAARASGFDGLLGLAEPFAPPPGGITLYTFAHPNGNPLRLALAMTVRDNSLLSQLITPQAGGGWKITPITQASLQLLGQMDLYAATGFVTKAATLAESAIAQQFGANPLAYAGQLRQLAAFRAAMPVIIQCADIGGTNIGLLMYRLMADMLAHNTFAAVAPGSDAVGVMHILVKAHAEHAIPAAAAPHAA